jgi:hypothetical protein
MALFLSIRLDSEVPLEVGICTYIPGRRNIRHLASELGRRKGNNEYLAEYVLFLLFRLFVCHIPFRSLAPIPPQMSMHTIQSSSNGQRRSSSGLDTTASRAIGNQLWLQLPS